MRFVSLLIYFQWEQANYFLRQFSWLLVDAADEKYLPVAKLAGFSLYLY